MAFNFNSIERIAGEHKGQQVIWLRFPYNADLVADVRNVGARWSQSEKCWYLKDSTKNRQLTNLPQKAVGKDVMAQIGDVNRVALLRLEETLRLKAYSPGTLRTYCTEFAQLLY